MGFFFGTGPSWEKDSLNEIQVSSVLNSQQRNSRENQSGIPYEFHPEEQKEIFGRNIDFKC